MIDASEGTLAELRAAVQPVYDEIEKDPGTKATINAIEALRANSTAAPDAVKCNVAASSPAPPAAAGVSPIDGTWRVCYTLEELMAAGALEGENRPENAGCGTKTFRQGQFWELRDGSLFDPGEPHGTFTVEGSTVTLTPKDEPETWQFEWSTFTDTLTFKKAGNGGPTGFVVKPFHKVADLASPLVGTYKTSFSKEELVSSCCSRPGRGKRWQLGRLHRSTWTKVTFTQATSPRGQRATYSATKDQSSSPLTRAETRLNVRRSVEPLPRHAHLRATDEELPTPYVLKAGRACPDLTAVAGSGRPGPNAGRLLRLTCAQVLLTDRPLFGADRF
jgi:hypothetical protein